MRLRLLGGGTDTKKTSAPGIAVRLHLRPAAGDLKLGWEMIQTSLRAHCPLALAEEQRARGTVLCGFSGNRARQQACPADTEQLLWTLVWASDHG